MAGNEINLTRFLYDNLNQINLPHLGLITEIGAPSPVEKKYTVISNVDNLNTLKTESSRKKADIYLNSFGVSIKQSGGSFAYNRLQRRYLVNVFALTGCENPAEHIRKLDTEVDRFHEEEEGRNVPWNVFFEEIDFKNLLQFLMMKGSGRFGLSSHPASYILEGPSADFSQDNINMYTFEEYYNKYRDNFYIAIRRTWIGQLSKSEHTRAVGLAKNIENRRWVFDNVSGQPDERDGKRWRDDFPVEKRKTVYVISIEKSLN